MSNIKEIKCEEALKQVFDYLDQSLGQHKHDEMNHHISRCRSCFSRVEFEKKLHERLNETGEEAAPESLHNKINDLLKGY
jgi:mycothiol system anti-sigma-R factor